MSFCLVVFYQSQYRLGAGLVTIFSNRVGDVLFLFCFGYFLLGASFRLEVFRSSRWLLLLFFFVGAVVKRAQFPFSA
jgi:NADH:ubiquinone oxidoreductase subunit 5 (subunit L)/multisubunit Na+/H+ antiporter MnhA subunit